MAAIFGDGVRCGWDGGRGWGRGRGRVGVGVGVGGGRDYAEMLKSLLN